MQRVELEPAFVLHRRPYRETSLLAEALTRDHGRIGLIARGARRGRSSQSATLQPFRPVLVSWSGRGDLRTLTGIEAGETVDALVGRALLSGFYVNELILRLVGRHDPNPELFAVYAVAIDALRHESGIESSLRIFEKRLLDAIGYGMPLQLEADSGVPVREDGRYRFDPERGAVGTTATSGSATLVSGRTLLALADERLDDPDVLHQAKRLMREVLGQYLGSKPLQSRQLFNSPNGGKAGK